jgi:hypothetical protein
MCVYYRYGGRVLNPFCILKKWIVGISLLCQPCEDHINRLHWYFQQLMFFFVSDGCNFVFNPFCILKKWIVGIYHCFVQPCERSHGTDTPIIYFQQLMFFFLWVMDGNFFSYTRWHSWKGKKQKVLFWPLLYINIYHEQRYIFENIILYYIYISSNWVLPSWQLLVRGGKYLEVVGRTV